MQNVIDLPVGILLFSALIFFCIFLLMSRPLKMSELMAVFIVLLLLYGCFNTFTAISISNGKGFDTPVNGFESVMDTVNLINTDFPQGNVKFVYNVSERQGEYYYGGLFRSINSIFLFNANYISNTYPDISPGNLNWFLSQANNQLFVIYLSPRSNDYPDLNNHFKNLTVTTNLISIKKIENGKVIFYIYELYIKKPNL
jgi:hypothetical protein